MKKQLDTKNLGVLFSARHATLGSHPDGMLVDNPDECVVAEAIISKRGK